MTDSTDRSGVELEFRREVLAGVARLQREINYNPTRFRQMVGELGAVGAARALLRGRDASDGFTTLWANDRLAMSIEATALEPWFAELFTGAERDAATRRLRAHNFDVEGFLQDAEARWPAWATRGNAAR